MFRSVYKKYWNKSENHFIEEYGKEYEMIVLITGASHTGKTVLAQKLLEKYKYPYFSIDHLKMGLIRSGYTKLKSEDVPYADIWCFGFPCQDISVAGKQRGLVGKEVGIYYNIIDLLKGKEESAKPT